MNTLMITSRNQGLSFNEAEAVAPFAIIEKVWSFGGQLLKAARSRVASRDVTLAPATA